MGKPEVTTRLALEPTELWSLNIYLENLTNKEIDKNNQVHGHYISAEKL